MRAIRIYIEPLSIEELDFLLKKEQKDKGQFYLIMRIVMSGSVLLPFLFAWYRAFEGQDDPFSITYYFIGLSVTVVVALLIGYAIYKKGLYKIRADIRDRTKTVESTHITRKQFMPANDEYYFFIDSPTLLSIRVSKLDYDKMRKGDELNIEYSTHAKYYFGYF